MRLFRCDVCGQTLHFENSHCLSCGARLGFLPDRFDLTAVDAQPDGMLRPRLAPDAAQIACGNATATGCNWLVPAGTGRSLCTACELNRTIPDLTITGNAEKWTQIEEAKRRLVYALLRFDLPLTGANGPIRFDFMADTGGTPVLTGHADGVITVNIAEADPAERESRRTRLGEPYRTVLGHLRHEMGHFYWDVLVRDRGQTDAAQAVFGDASADYAAALQNHYDQGPPADWQSGFVSAYATVHPLEDFAETWAHYLHMIDTLDTAASFALQVTVGDDTAPPIPSDPYAAPDLATMQQAWVPLTVALNSLNRSMGQPDAYPFAPSPTALAKLGFVHDLVRHAR